MAVVVSVGDAICFGMLGKLACSEMVCGGWGGCLASRLIIPTNKLLEFINSGSITSC